MILLNDRKLAEKFRNNEVSSKERLIYLLIFVLVSTILHSNLFEAWTYQKPDWWDLISDLSEFAITVVGTIICYFSNSDGDNKEFIERYTCLGVVITMKIAIFLIAILVLIYAIVSNSSGNINSNALNGFSFFLVNITNIYLYIRLNKSIKIAADVPLVDTTIENSSDAIQ